MRVIVCGGRHFRNRKWLFETLDYLDFEYVFDILIHGDASGADRLAGEWAKERGCHFHPEPAQWKRYNNAAGPIRNQKMLDDWKPHLVVAFPGGSGTEDMITRASNAGVEVISF